MYYFDDRRDDTASIPLDFNDAPRVTYRDRSGMPLERGDYEPRVLPERPVTAEIVS